MLSGPPFLSGLEEDVCYGQIVRIPGEADSERNRGPRPRGGCGLYAAGSQRDRAANR